MHNTIEDIEHNEVTPYKDPNPFEGKTIYCKVLDVHDGTSVTLGFMLDGRLVSKRCIFKNHISPNIRDGVELMHRREKDEREDGNKARNFLRGMLIGRAIDVRFYEYSTNVTENQPLISACAPGSHKSVSSLVISEHHGHAP